MSTWYKVSGHRQQISPVEIEKNTDHFVFVRDPYGYGTEKAKAKVVRLAIRSECGAYFPTWEDAHAYVLERAERSVRDSRLRLEQANGHLGNVKGLKKPEGAA